AVVARLAILHVHGREDGAVFRPLGHDLGLATARARPELAVAEAAARAPETPAAPPHLSVAHAQHCGRELPAPPGRHTAARRLDVDDGVGELHDRHGLPDGCAGSRAGTLARGADRLDADRVGL